jgi:zinc transporter, ZIP family
MNFAQTVFLGAIAGLTIYLGLPMGRMKAVSAKVRTFLSMASAGIIIFLLIDIFSKLSEPIAGSLKQALSGQEDYGEFALLLAIFVAGFGFGLIGLIYFEQRFIRFGRPANQVLSPSRLALLIAIGLGLHNFSEGLAIGQSAGRGEIALALILIIGFGLHNATEGFGIVGPLVGERPSWAFLGVVGLIGGGPTFLGTLIGYHIVSTTMFVLFLALAEGALIFVLGELFNVSRRPGTRSVAGWGLMAGFLFAFLTDLVLTIAGV